MDDTGEKVRQPEPPKEPVKHVRLMKDVRRIDRPRNIGLTSEPLDQIDRKKCRQWVEENFTVEKMVEGHEKLYKKILGA